MEGYKKDFESWNRYIQNLDFKEAVHNFRERELWWCAIGVNVGSEQDGKNASFERPVLIIRRINQGVLWIAPLTTKFLENEYRISVKCCGEESQILLSQIRTISSKRLLRRIGRIKNETFNKTIIALSLLLLQSAQNETPP